MMMIPSPTTYTHPKWGEIIEVPVFGGAFIVDGGVYRHITAMDIVRIEGVHSPVIRRSGAIEVSRDVFAWAVHLLDYLNDRGKVWGSYTLRLWNPDDARAPQNISLYCREPVDDDVVFEVAIEPPISELMDSWTNDDLAKLCVQAYMNWRGLHQHLDASNKQTIAWSRRHPQ